MTAWLLWHIVQRFCRAQYLGHEPDTTCKVTVLLLGIQREQVFRRRFCTRRRISGQRSNQCCRTNLCCSVPHIKFSLRSLLQLHRPCCVGQLIAWNFTGFVKQALVPGIGPDDIGPVAAFGLRSPRNLLETLVPLVASTPNAVVWRR